MVFTVPHLIHGSPDGHLQAKQRLFRFHFSILTSDMDLDRVHLQEPPSVHTAYHMPISLSIRAQTGWVSQRNGLQLKSDVFIPLCCTHGTPPCPKISSCMVGCMVKSSAQWALEMSEHVDHHCALSVVVFISFWLLCFLFRPLGLNFRPCADPSFIQLASPCLLFSCIPSTKWPTT